MSKRILSVNVGRRQTIEIKGRPVETGIFKTPASGPVWLDAEGFEGDARVEPRKLGEEHHAACAYPHEHYAHWMQRLGRGLFPPGQFGENLTVTGLLEAEVRVGDVLRCGSALLQVSQPRTPCRKLDARMGLKLARLFLESRRVGYYLRVLEPGYVQAGDPVEFVDSDSNSPTIDEFMRICELDTWDVAGLDYLLAARNLVPGWSEILEAKRRRALEADGWFGLRELEVVEREEDSTNVVSLWLRCARGRPLPSFSAGQYLTVAVRVAPDMPVFRRAYAISSPPRDPSGYRIGVLRQGSVLGESAGTVSGYIHRHLQPGDTIQAAAPRGFFTLDAMPSNRDAVVFVAEGIGVAPVVSMLHDWAAKGCPERAYLFFTSGDRREHPLRSDVIDLAAARQNLEIHLLHPPPSGGSTAAAREAAERAMKVARTNSCDVFISGSTSFVTGVRESLQRLGLDSERIHEERFGAS